ncbi:MAG: hypothetical protein HN337_00940 [Deltaproteobacteria bacterium]|nr:hypothetical protein [Deltaproteobacteria bacterium]
MKSYVAVFSVFLTIFFLTSCGGASPNTPTSVPIAIEGVDGETGVSTAAAFVYTFNTAPDSATVTSDTFFLYPTSLTQESKVDAAISANSYVEYQLTPDELLQEDTLYALIVRLTQITDDVGEPLGTEDIMVVFSTGDDVIPAFVGTLDLTFGSPNGYITGSALGAFDNKFGIALDSGDNIYYMEGYNDPQGYTVRKYDSQGSMDTSFGTGGLVDGTDTGIQASQMLIDSGNVYLVGTDDDNRLKLLKFDTDGNFVDSATYPTTQTEPYGAALDVSGNIVITGRSGEYPTPDLAIWRYSSALSLDSSFGAGGVVTYDYSGSGAVGSNIALDSAGNIYTQGTVSDDDFVSTVVIILKFDSSGNLVNSFGESGILTMEDYSSAGLGIDVSDDIFVGMANDYGTCSVTTYGAKIDTDGNIDTSFGSSGIFDFEGENVGIGGLTIDGDENAIVPTYACTDSASYEMIVWVVDGAAGDLVTASGDNGKITFSNFGIPFPGDVVMDSEGRTLISGVDFENEWASNEPPFFIMRLR